MPRPEVDKECLERINNVVEKSEKTLGIFAKSIVHQMLQQNHELTDSITAVTRSFAKIFCEKFSIKPTGENLREVINDMVFMNGIAPIIKELIKADKEARND